MKDKYLNKRIEAEKSLNLVRPNLMIISNSQIENLLMKLLKTDKTVYFLTKLKSLIIKEKQKFQNY